MRKTRKYRRSQKYQKYPKYQKSKQKQKQKKKNKKTHKKKQKGGGISLVELQAIFARILAIEAPPKPIVTGWPGLHEIVKTQQARFSTTPPTSWGM